jgi:fructose-specific phosphotransferase system IIC component
MQRMATTRETARSGVVGGLFAGLLLGLFLLLGTGGDQLRMQADLYTADPAWWMGWLAHLAHSIALGLVYAAVVAAYTNWYVDLLLSFTRRSDRLTGAVMPLIRTFGIGTVVMSGMGLTFGLLVWLGLTGGAVPLVLDSAEYPFPQLDAVAIVGYLVYGLVLGTLYGIQVSRA